MRYGALALVLALGPALATGAGVPFVPAPVSAAEPGQRAVGERVAGARPEGRDAAAVQQAFDGVRSALEAGNGKQVVAGLSGQSVQRLEAMRRAARHPSGGAGAGGLGLSERLVTESMRRTLTPADLSRRSLDEVMTRALSHQEGLGKELVKGSLGPVSVKGDRAVAPLLIQGKPSLFQADFVRDSGGWKIDLLPVFHRGDLVLTTMAALKGSTPDALIESILSGVKPQLRRPG